MAVLLFSLTTGVSALLLFTVQPMLAKLLLPSFGGTPAVWYATLFFFQCILLLGYCYVHFFYKVAQRWGMRIPSIVHVLALGAALIITLPLTVFTPTTLSVFATNQALSAAWMLAQWVALPVFFLCCTAPLIQHWFHALPQQRAGDPYFLYSASNAGSFLGLFLFPLALEPMLHAQQQLNVWSYSYGVYALLLAACCAFFLHTRRSAKQEKKRPKASGKVAALSGRQRLWWVVLAFVPSSLLIGSTNHISQDIASFPLLWVLPLAVYLATFVIAFTKHNDALLKRSLVAQVTLNAAMALFYFFSHTGLVMLHLFTFFANAMVCHGLLARQRPHAKFLSEYYIWIGLGGALGSVFNLFIAPLFFSNYIEYGLMLMVALLLPQLMNGIKPHQLKRDLLIGGGFAAAVLLLHQFFLFLGKTFGPGFAVFIEKYLSYEHLITFFALPNILASVLIFITYLLALRMYPYVVRCALIIGCLFVISMPTKLDGGTTIFRARNFFGLLRVVDGADGNRHLMHGTTLHGTQSLDPNHRLDVISYYALLKEVIRAEAYNDRPRKVGLMGLGAGTIACLLRPSDDLDIVEINPAVIAVAENPEYFTFMRDCAPHMRIFLGDGRLEISKQPDASYDLIIMDAFSSDSIPIHLVTKEAIAMYQKKLRRGGSIAIHISNRYLDLIPLVRGLAESANTTALFKMTDAKENQLAALWSVITLNTSVANELKANGWETFSDTKPVLWTDRSSSIIKLLR